MYIIGQCIVSSSTAGEQIKFEARVIYQRLSHNTHLVMLRDMNLSCHVRLCCFPIYHKSDDISRAFVIDDVVPQLCLI